jgi:tripartite-type tricarboxylate transporter receptor subunit TctC
MVPATVCSEPETRRRLGMVGIELTPSTPQEFSAFRQAESQRWGQLIRDHGILAE